MLQANMAMSSTYDLRLVALSVVIAVSASYTALDLAGRVTVSKARTRLVWLICGAIVMGIGIWSMHFVGMLALSLPIAMSYDVLTVLLSMLPAIFASGSALFLASRPVMSKERLLIGGVLMGIGIASMHYIGMAAMRMKAATQYDPMLFMLSVAIAIIASIIALWIAFRLRLQFGKASLQRKILSAVVLAAAISGMHYTGMAAASFTPTSLRNAPTVQETQASFTWLAVDIGIVTLIILSFTLLASFMNQQMVTQAMLLKQQEAEAQRSQLFTEVTLRIRQSLNRDNVLNTTVHEVRKALNVDRVVVYRFNPDWSGTIIAESVVPGWVKTLGKTVNDPFRKDYLEMYKNGRVQATNNIYEANFTDCHREILEGFQIQANVVAPILSENRLLGLLCAHQCSGPRMWQKAEIDLFGQFAIQVSIALEQATLVDELSTAHEVLRVRDRAIAAASNAIIITDPRQPDNPIIFCNPAFEVMTGYTPQEVLGRNCRFLQGSDTDVATVEQIRTAIREEYDCQVVLKNYRKDGTPFWCELSISPIRDRTGQVINFVGVQTDITSRKKAEEELRRSKEALQHQLVELISDVTEVANGDLTARVEMTTGQIGIVADFFNSIIESLQQIVNQVKQTTQQVNVSVGKNSDAINQLANEALNQADEIIGTLEEVNQMTLSLEVVANRAQEAAKVSRTASNTALVAGQAMEHTVSSIFNLQQTVTDTSQKIKHFSESSQEISKVVTMIHQIALQTNLLSINAGLEASRAGEENHGFAVVAQEVGRLAAQSAQATQEIEHIVQNIQSESNEVVQAIELGTTQVIEGAQLVKDVKQSMEKIIEVSRQIDELVESISQTTVSQAHTSQAVALLMNEIAKASERTADSSRFVSTSLQETIKVAQQLQASVSVFKTEV